MRRRSFTHALIGATLVHAAAGPIAASAKGPDGFVGTKRFAIAPDIDGIVIRGTWQAHVSLGDPQMTVMGIPSRLRAVTIERNGTTLTLAQSSGSNSAPLLRVTLAHLRGLATSGSVFLTLEDDSDAPLFLDLAGAGTVRATGSVRLLRVTTSGTVSADLTALSAATARVHARQASRLAIRARHELTIVALDRAHVSYRGATSVHVTSRARATVTRL